MKTAAIVRRSFIAMFWGWVACNSTILFGRFIYELIYAETGPATMPWGNIMAWMIYTVVGTSIVIGVAWLLIFLPAALVLHHPRKEQAGVPASLSNNPPMTYE